MGHKNILTETNHMRKLMGLKPIVGKVITEKLDTGLTPEEQNAVDQGTNKDPEGYTVAPTVGADWCQRQVSSDWYFDKLKVGNDYLKKYVFLILLINIILNCGLNRILSQHTTM